MANCPNTDDLATQSAQEDAEAAVLCLINEARATADPPAGPLTLNAKLRTVAREHAMAAATIKWWPSGDAGHVPHVNPVTHKDEQVRIKEAGYCPSNPDVARNENAYAYSFTGDPALGGQDTTPAAAVRFWLGSDDHHRTLMDPVYTETGVGVVRGTASMDLPAGSDGAIFVQCFGGCLEREPLVPTQPLWAWGDNRSGQLGDGGATSETSSPIHPSDFEGFIMIAAYHHSVGLKRDGTVWTWGPNENKGTVPGGSDVPVNVDGIDQVIAVSAGYSHNLALKNDGSVWAWGDNSWGELGDGSGADQELPVRVRDLIGIKAIAAGDCFSLALSADGSVWGWGANGNDQLGREGVAPNDRFRFPIRISSLTGRCKAIAAGQYHTIALEDDPGQMWVFGSNGSGRLGTGDPDQILFPDPTKPAATGNFTGRDIVSIAAGPFNSYAVDKAGRVWAMGGNSFHQLGPNVDTLSDDALAHQIPGLPRIVKVSAGAFHVLALTGDDGLWSWGSNNAGELGHGVIGPDHGPGQIGIDQVMSFSAGSSHSLAIGRQAF